MNTISLSYCLFPLPASLLSLSHTHSMKSIVTIKNLSCDFNKFTLITKDMIGLLSVCLYMAD
jgi:hypothetical protein